jgi:hypothetical protein
MVGSLSIENCEIGINSKAIMDDKAAIPIPKKIREI